MVSYFLTGLTFLVLAFSFFLALELSFQPFFGLLFEQLKALVVF